MNGSGRVPRAWAWLRWVDRVNGVLVKVASVLVLCILVLTLGEVVTRYVFHDPSTWTLPAAAYLLLYVVYLGTAHTLQVDGHVRVEFVLELLPPRWRRALDILSECLGFVFVVVFGYLTVRLVEITVVQGQYDETTLHIPLVLANIVMPFGVLFMAIAYIPRIARYFLPDDPQREP